MPRYFNKRGGLPNFSQKLAAGEVTVGYLGGSLTMMKEGWRPSFHAWLNQSFPRPKPHRELHVGRGGVGAASGVFFVQEEICGKDPDLVFVEYAINDSFALLTPPALRMASVEGIVRSIKQRHPACDICFLYMHHIARGPAIELVIADYENIAEHYGLPSVFVGRCLCDLVSGGAWSFTGETSAPPLLRDNCHPLPSGNVIVTQLITDAVQDFMSVPQPLVSDSRATGSLLPKSICANPLVNGRVIPVQPEMIRGRYEKKTGHVGNINEQVTRYCLAQDACLIIQGGVSVFGLYVVVGPQSGIISASSGTRTVERCLFDQWCSYDRIATCIIAESADDLFSSLHEMVVKLTDRLPDYSICPKLEAIPTSRMLDVVGLFVM